MEAEIQDAKWQEEQKNEGIHQDTYDDRYKEKRYV